MLKYEDFSSLFLHKGKKDANNLIHILKKKFADFKEIFKKLFLF